LVGQDINIIMLLIHVSLFMFLSVVERGFTTFTMTYVVVVARRYSDEAIPMLCK